MSRKMPWIAVILLVLMVEPAFLEQKPSAAKPTWQVDIITSSISNSTDTSVEWTAPDDTGVPFNSYPVTPDELTPSKYQELPPFMADDPEMPASYREEAKYNFTTPHDIVFLLDRSGSIGEQRFKTEVKRFLDLFLRSAVTLHPDHTRIAVLTFTKEIQEDINYVSEGSQVSACELFGPGGAFSKLMYDSNDSYGSDLIEALKQARAILQTGQQLRAVRKNDHYQQDVWILSDGQDLTPDTNAWASLLKKDNIHIYAVGLGYYLDENKLKNITSFPDSHFYHSYDQWMKLLPTNFASNDVGTSWVTVSEEYCEGCGSGAACYCHEFRDDNPRCACKPGFHQDSESQCIACEKNFYKEFNGIGDTGPCLECPSKDNITSTEVMHQCYGVEASKSWVQKNNLQLILILVHVAVVTIAIIFIMSQCFLRHKRKKKKEKEKRDTTEQQIPEIYTQTITSSMPSTHDTNPEDDYANQVAVDLLADLGRHGRLRSPSESSGSSPSNLSHGIHSTTQIHSSAAPQTSTRSNDSGIGIDRTSYISSNYQTIPETVVSNHQYISTIRGQSQGQEGSDNESGEDSHESKETIMRLSKMRKQSPFRVPSSIKRLPKLPRVPPTRRDTLDHPSYKRRSKGIDNHNEDSSDYENEATIERLKRFGPPVTGTVSGPNGKHNYGASNRRKLQSTPKGPKSSVKMKAKRDSNRNSAATQTIKNLISMFEKKERNKQLAHHNGLQSVDSGDYLEPVAHPPHSYITIIG